MKINIILFMLLAMVSCKYQHKQELHENKKNQEKQESCDNQEQSKKLLVNKKNRQQMEPDNEKMIIKKFDIETFKTYNKYGTYEFTSTEGIKVKQKEKSEYPSGKVLKYYEYRNYLGSPYEYYNEYDVSGNIVKSAVSFYHISTGIAKEYNSSGNITKKTNFDTGYPFTIPMLIKKMNEEYEIDLLEAKDKSAYRYVDEEYLHIPVYRIELSFETPTAMYRDIYLIDGNTGKMLHKAKRLLWEDPFNLSEPIEAEYLRMKENADNEHVEKENSSQSQDKENTNNERIERENNLQSQDEDDEIVI